MRQERMRNGTFTVCALAAMLSGGAIAHGAAFTWNGGGTDDNFSTAANWGGSAPTSVNTDDLTFGGSTRLTPNVDVNNPWVVHSITFAAGAGAFTIGGNQLHFSGTGQGLTNSSSVTQTFNNAIRITNGRTFSANSGDIEFNGDITFDNSASLFARGGRHLIIDGKISGNGSVGRTDPGIVYLNNNANDFTGELAASHGVIVAGTIADAGVASAIGAGSVIRLGQGTWGPSDTGTLRYTGVTASTNRTVRMTSNNTYGGSTPVVGSSGRPTLEVTDANTTLTFNGNFEYHSTSTMGQWRLHGAGNGVINGNITTTGAKLEKNGAGTWTLNGTNGYTGITEVKGGKLLVNGSIVSDTTVSANATLGGDGTISANAIVNAGGTMAAGNSVGTLTVTGNTTLAGTLKTELDGATTDLLIVGGALDITAATVDFDVLTTLTGGPYVFATYGSLVGTQFATVTDLPTGYTIDYAYGGDSIALVTVIPSPAALPVLGLGLLAARRRRG